jgi:hypothetical protein
VVKQEESRRKAGGKQEESISKSLPAHAIDVANLYL